MEGYFKIIKITIIKQTRLHFAVKNGHIEIVKLLIEKGAEINLKDKKGRVYFKIIKITIIKQIPLHFATSNGYIEIIKLLIENGADINLKNIWGEVYF